MENRWEQAREIMGQLSYDGSWKKLIRFRVILFGYHVIAKLIFAVLYRLAEKSGRLMLSVPERRSKPTELEISEGFAILSLKT